MGRRAHYEIPADMQDAQKQFEHWRSSHSGRQPIPDSLWSRATEVAGRHGVFRTAQQLRLDYSKLKRHLRETTSDVRPQTTPPPAFVELIAPEAHACDCIIEVEGPRGRMRIEWKGSTAPDLAGLSRALWEPGA
jgi:hypothetical protein